MSLHPGEVVEHFVIDCLLGEGGMGQVYVARDTRLQRMVALKIVHPAKEGSLTSEGASSGAARLLREARAAAGLDHPNVVTIYEVGEIQGGSEEAGRPYIAMELVKGRTLRAFVGDEAVPVEQRVRWLADVARALAAAHRANLVHRDIKPENVMVRGDGVVKVLDFGVAKRAVSPSVSSTTSTEGQILPSLTSQGVAVGTPYYMAPEQMRREGLDGRADQFSWAVVAYELLSGHPPWGRDLDALELVSKLLTEVPAPLDRVCADVPREVAAVVARAMAKKREERFETMDEVVSALAGAPTPRVSLRPVNEEAGAAALPHAKTQLEFRSGPRRRPLGRAGRAGAVVALVALATGTAWLVARRGAEQRAGGSLVAPPASAPKAAVECAGHAECVEKLGGKPAVCNAGHKCAPVESAQCKAYYEPEDLKRDDTVWVGAMFPLSGEWARFGVSNMNAVELGRRDFAQAHEALRAPDGHFSTRAVGLVACDDSAADRAVAGHLVSDLSVPAIILGGGKAVDLASSLFVPSGTLTVATLTLSPLLASVPHAPDQPRMVWRTTYDNTETAHALAALVERLEGKLRADGSLARGERMKLAVVRPRDPSNARFAETLFQDVHFNGKSALDNGDAYREFSFSRGMPDDYSEASSGVARFEPTIVVASANANLLPAIESKLAPRARRPYYMTPATLDDESLAFARGAPDRRRRLFGLTTTSTTVPNARFVVHYNETFPDRITRAWAPNSSYDAFYLLAYAIYARGALPVEGAALSGAISKLLPPGRPIDVGDSAILEAYGTLRRGESIDLNGATGSMDFDVKTGEAPVNLAVVCAGTDGAGQVSEAIESGLVFDAKTKRLVGEPSCP